MRRSCGTKGIREPDRSTAARSTAATGRQPARHRLTYHRLVTSSLLRSGAAVPRQSAGTPSPSVLVRLPVALLAGVALCLAFPGTGWWWLAAPAVGALALACRGVPARTGALLGLVFGLASFIPMLHWSGIYVGLLPWMALSVLESLFLAAVGALLPLAWRAPGGPFGTALAVAGLWAGQEWARSTEPFGGFPWGRLAFSQSDGPLLGLAALGGAPLVSFGVALLGGGLAVAARAAAARRPLRLLGALVAVPALLAAGPLVPLVHDTPGRGPHVQVAAVQGDVPQPGLEFNARRRAVLDNHVSATVALAQRVREGRATAPDLVLWPENSSDIDPLRNPDAAAVIQQAADAINAPVLVGAVLEQPAGMLSNAAIVWGTDASGHPGPQAMYVKHHPAPFAEYIPYRSFFRHFSDKVDLVSRDFAAGTGPSVVPLAGVRVGTAICFEVAYDPLVRRAVEEGAQLLVVPTNNATFGYSDESVQQLAMSRLRAVETGRALVHVSTVGVSALFLPDGTQVARSGLFTQQVLQASLPLETGRTLAVRLGGWTQGLLSGLGALLLALAWARGAAARRRSPTGRGAPTAAERPAERR